MRTLAYTLKVTIVTIAAIALLPIALVGLLMTEVVHTWDRWFRVRQQ